MKLDPPLQDFISLNKINLAQYRHTKGKRC
jgi:hypothetical protein